MDDDPYILKDGKKSAVTYLLMVILGLGAWLLTRQSTNPETAVSGVLFFASAVCAFIALLAVVLTSDAAAALVGAGIYAFFIALMAVLLFLAGNPFIVALTCVAGGIALIIGASRKRIGWALIGWVVFFVGMFIISRIFF